jgi:hypothetical protein
MTVREIVEEYVRGLGGAPTRDRVEPLQRDGEMLLAAAVPLLSYWGDMLRMDPVLFRRMMNEAMDRVTAANPREAANIEVERVIEELEFSLMRSPPCQHR